MMPPQELLMPPQELRGILPKELDRLRRPDIDAIAEKSFAISNGGNSPIALKLWDPEGMWRDISIAPVTFVLVTCPRCEKDAKIAYHDGKKIRYYSIPVGSAASINWSPKTGTWEIAGSGTEMMPPN
jgi:hypothetical protein